MRVRDELVARVGLEPDGGRSALLVQSAHAENGIDQRKVAYELAAALAAEIR